MGNVVLTNLISASAAGTGGSQAATCYGLVIAVFGWSNTGTSYTATIDGAAMTQLIAVNSNDAQAHLRVLYAANVSQGSHTFAWSQAGAYGTHFQLFQTGNSPGAYSNFGSATGKTTPSISPTVGDTLFTAYMENTQTLTVPGSYTSLASATINHSGWYSSMASAYRQDVGTGSQTATWGSSGDGSTSGMNAILEFIPGGKIFDLIPVMIG